MFVKVVQSIGCGLFASVGIIAGVLIEWSAFLPGGVYRLLTDPSRTYLQSDVLLLFVSQSLLALTIAGSFSMFACVLFYDFVLSKE